MKTRVSVRHAYVEAEVVTGLAHQIRALRMDRKLSQSSLAKKLGTTQTVVSRLEDPTYGRYTLQTLLELAKVFDTGMQVNFVSTVTMLSNTFYANAENRVVPTFEDEAEQVGFYTMKPTLAEPRVALISDASRSNQYFTLSVITNPTRQVQIDLTPSAKEIAAHE